MTEADQQSERELRMESCQCGICEHTFSDDTVVAMARSIARHWNDEHGDELRYSMQPFDEVEYGGHHITDDVYQIRRKQFYVTVYDVLNIDGGKPFKYQYVKKPEAQDVCEDCWRSIEGVSGYTELESDGWRDKFLCNECREQREIDRRREENQDLAGFATDGGLPMNNQRRREGDF